MDRFPDLCSEVVERLHHYDTVQLEERRQMTLGYALTLRTTAYRKEMPSPRAIWED